MTSQENQKFIKYLMESYVDEPSGEVIRRHLKPFQDWARVNNMNSVGDQTNLSHMEEMKLQAERYVKGLRKLKSLDSKEFYRLFMNTDYFFETGGFFLNPSGFTKTLEMLGDDQQVKEWVEKVLNGKVIGAYAQTELGHGSNVQGLETEARYDEGSQTWTFNSPKASSAKFWPGLLGIYSNSVVLQAKAYVKGKSIGVQTFAFTIRDNNLDTLPGVEVGEMGSKLGMAFLDHGFLRFTDFKQPRRAMLMRFVQVLENGTVNGLENKQSLKYGYGSMLNLRVFLTTSFGSSSYKNLRHAANYFGQANLLENPEVKDLLLSGFSISIGIVIANKQTGRIFTQFTKHMKEKEYEHADKLLEQCHIISSTLKAMTSWKTLEISKALLTFNPILILKNSFIPHGFTNGVPSATYEGDNSVLLQLTAKYLLKQPDQEPSKPQIVNAECFDFLVKAFEFIFLKQLQRNKLLMSKDMENGFQLLQIWNERLQAELLNLSKLWGRYILVKFYNESYKQYSGPSKDLLYKIGLTFIHSLVNDSKELFSFYDLDIPKVNCTEKFTKAQFEMLRTVSHWSPLSKYQLSTDALQSKMNKIENQVLRAKL